MDREGRMFLGALLAIIGVICIIYSFIGFNDTGVDSFKRDFDTIEDYLKYNYKDKEFFNIKEIGLFYIDEYEFEYTGDEVKEAKINEPYILTTTYIVTDESGVDFNVSKTIYKGDVSSLSKNILDSNKEGIYDNYVNAILNGKLNSEVKKEIHSKFNNATNISSEGFNAVKTTSDARVIQDGIYYDKLSMTVEDYMKYYKDENINIKLDLDYDVTTDNFQEEIKKIKELTEDKNLKFGEITANYKNNYTITLKYNIIITAKIGVMNIGIMGKNVFGDDSLDLIYDKTIYFGDGELGDFGISYDDFMKLDKNSIKFEEDML